MADGGDDGKDIHRIAKMNFVENNVGGMAFSFQGNPDDRHGFRMKQSLEIPNRGP